MSQPGGESARRPPWAELRRDLEARGFRPSRRLGQNFLLDENLARLIAREAELTPEERVLEVGAGCGFLTSHLLAEGARVLAVELDARLHELLGQRFSAEPSFELLHADILAGKHALAPAVLERLPAGEPWSLVSNLPYSVASPVVLLASRLAAPPRRMTILVQREVADRLLAGAGEPARGALGVRLQALYRGSLLRTVPAAAFWPKPKVESAVVRLERRPDAPAPERLEGFDRLVGELFASRRKALRGGVRRLAGSPEDGDAVLEAAGVGPLQRAEELSLEAFWGLLEALDPGA